MFQLQNMLIGHRELSEEEIMKLLKKREKQLTEGIDLVDGVKIRRISKEDLEDINTLFFYRLHPYKEFSPHMFVLEKYITVEKEHKLEAHQIMRNVVLALRLLKGGYVSGGYVFYILLSEKRRLESWSWEEEPRRPGGFVYSLNFGEIPSLKKILVKIQGIDFAKRKSLHLACKRFQRACQEDDFEDQLIDFMIAFEALFLKGEKAVSIGQILAIACSTLLGKNYQEREEIRRFLTKAYSIRNHTVHGAEYEKPYIKKEYEMFEFVPKIEDYLRESINKLLD